MRPGRGASLDRVLAGARQVVHELLAVLDAAERVAEATLLHRVLGQHAVVRIVVGHEDRDGLRYVTLHAALQLNPFLGRKGHHESRALTGRALRVDGAAMSLDDLLTDRQADARALVLRAAVQAMEWEEHALGVLLVEADAVVLDVDLRLSR